MIGVDFDRDEGVTFHLHGWSEGALLLLLVGGIGFWLYCIVVAIGVAFDIGLGVL